MAAVPEDVQRWTANRRTCSGGRVSLCFFARQVTSRVSAVRLAALSATGRRHRGRTTPTEDPREAHCAFRGAVGGRSQEAAAWLARVESTRATAENDRDEKERRRHVAMSRVQAGLPWNDLRPMGSPTGCRVLETNVTPARTTERMRRSAIARRTSGPPRNDTRRRTTGQRAPSRRKRADGLAPSG
jgi:hypothetical protein